jgi:hypothetical protein
MEVYERLVKENDEDPADLVIACEIQTVALLTLSRHGRHLPPGEGHCQGRKIPRRTLRDPREAREQGRAAALARSHGWTELRGRYCRCHR